MYRLHLILLSLMLVTMASAQAELPLKEPGMEVDANKDGLPDGWSKYISIGTAQLAMDPEVKHGGTAALRIELQAGARATVTQLLPVTQPGMYTFGCWLKTKLAAGANAHAYVQWRRGNEIVRNDVPSAPLTGEKDWTLVTCIGSKPAEADGALLVIVVEALKAEASTVWADDATFKQGAAPAALVLNGSFEQDENKDGLPDAWGKVIHGGGFEISRDTTVAHDGAASMKLAGQAGAADRAAITHVGPLYTPSKAVRLRLWYKGTGRADGVVRFRPAPGVVVQDDQYGTDFFKVDLPKQDWTELVFETAVPEAAQKAGQARVEVILYQRTEGTVWYDDVSVESLDEYKPKLTQVDEVLAMPLRPAAGRVVLQNPPDFSWPPVRGAAGYDLQLSQNRDFPAADTPTINCLYNVYSHSRTLGNGTWYWRVRCLDKAGAASDWGQANDFVVTAAAVPFPVPAAADLLKAIPASHPRVYATASTLAAFRAPMADKQKAWWESFKPRLEQLLTRPIDKEPGREYIVTPGAGGLTDADVQQLNKLRSMAGSANDRMQNLAFGYLLSGDRRYGDAAVAQMLEIATWDPMGATSYRNQDQVFRDIAWMMATAYDWCWDLMTPEQRDKVREAILVRARTLYKDFAEDGRPLNEYPYDSHGITAYGYLGIISIALAHESEEPDTWFKYIAATYPAVFPPWGGEEGGWSQGVGYWKWSQHFAWVFFDALKSATGLDMYDKAYTRNNGWYKLYMHPPWNDRHHFGDGNHGAPDATDQSNMARYAREYGNPYFRWYAQTMPGKTSFGLYSYLWHDETVPARPPADLPQGRYFPDIGWVAMHSDLSDADDVMLAFKSSQYGSYNHSHADQNSFVLYAYGEPLLIDSGYYDWYGSGHDVGFTRQTKAHNDILVNGEGQPIFDMTAQGRILKHFTSPAVDYALGDATPAYKGKLSKFQRHILYLRPNSFVIVDEVEAPEPSTFTWTLHAEQEMKLDPAKQEVTVTRGGARCLVKFITPQGLKLEQTDQFTPPSVRKPANEWHTSATTVEKSKKMRFVTFIRPARTSEPEQDLEVQAKLEGDLLLLVWGTTPNPGGVVAAWLGDGGPNFTVVGPWNDGAVGSVIGAKSLDLNDKQGNFRILQSEQPLTATLELQGKDNATAEVRTVHYQSETPTQVDLLVRQPVKTLSLDGTALPQTSYACAGERLKLQLPAGQHKLEVNPGSPQQAQAQVSVSLDGQSLVQQVQTMSRWTGGTLTWGSFEAQPQPVRVLKAEYPQGTAVQVNNGLAKAGDTLWLNSHNNLTVRGSSAKGVSLAFERLLKNDQPVTVPFAEAGMETTPGAVMLEAEAFTGSSNGSPSRYTNRPFLSGGVGMGNWTLPGMSVQWTLSVPKAGKYQVVVKGATHEPQADRLITLDGKPLGGEARPYRFPSTDGFGGTPKEWRLLALPNAQGQPLTLELTAGEHVLEMTCLASLLNLDFLVLVPVQ
ncbi:MAG: DUF4962 domain-containing protein [Armatimonadia bacterium]